MICPKPVVINFTQTWTKIDMRQLKFSETRCRTLYKDAPCLKYFGKLEEQVYRGICGKL